MIIWKHVEECYCFLNTSNRNWGFSGLSYEILSIELSFIVSFELNSLLCWIFSGISFQNEEAFRFIKENMLLNAAGSTASLAWPSCCRIRTRVMGWSEAYLNCRIYWFDRNSGIDHTILVQHTFTNRGLLSLTSVHSFEEIIFGHIHPNECLKICLRCLYANLRPPFFVLDKYWCSMFSSHSSACFLGSCPSDICHR